MKVVVALLATLLALAAQAAPSRVVAEYAVSKAGITIGRVIETYERTGDRYTIQSVTKSEGVLKVFVDDSLVVHSEGRFGAGGLQPLLFEQKRLRDNRRDLRATFDWAKGVMHSEYKGEAREVALPRGTQDRLSVMYQFMNLDARRDTVEMHMSNGRRVELYTYRKTGEVRIATPAGEFDTMHFERVIDGEGQSRAQVWLAKDRFNIPVRIVFDDASGRLDQTIVALSTE